MARPKKSSTGKTKMTENHVLNAITAEDSDTALREVLSAYAPSLAAMQNAVAKAQFFNKGYKPPKVLAEAMEAAKAAGGPGARAKVIGQTYPLTVARTKQLTVSTSAYPDWAGQGVLVKYEKDRIVITRDVA